jgi:hypothetical protein
MKSLSKVLVNTALIRFPLRFTSTLSLWERDRVRGYNNNNNKLVMFKSSMQSGLQEICAP